LLGCSPEAAADSATLAAGPLEAGQAEAIFAGGCFWCMEGPFEKLPGVIEVWSGYTGGPEQGPDYKAVASGQTGHVEAVRVVYDPAQVRYATLLEVFWRNIDPTQSDGQFCDRGAQYRSAIFPSGGAELAEAEASRAAAQARLGRAVVTEILPRAEFWVAEAYHQDFYKKNPGHYMRYRLGCGRDRRLLQLWGHVAP
jgi:peptide-methionine (S)-S-oxide reductase